MNSMDYRQYISRELDIRKNLNASYSLRSFARDLGLSVSRLSEVLSHKSGLSRAKARQVAERLRLGENESQLFLNLVEQDHARSPRDRMAARAKIALLRLKAEYVDIQPDLFEMVSNWYYLAILELTYLKTFQPDPAWIANMLDITPAEAETALQTLISLNLLKKSEDGRWKDAFEQLSILPKSPTMAVKSYQAQVLKKSAQALDSVSPDERDISSVVLCFDATKLTEVRELIKNFRRSFNEMMGTPTGNQVGCLSIHFFPLSKKLEGL